MTTSTFRAVIRIRGVNPFILVSASRANAVKPGWRKPLPVLVRINGKPARAWRINMMPVGNGSFYLYLHGDVRRVSGTKVGDRVQVEIDFDARYRGGPQHPLPTWFRQGLAGNAQAAATWKALTPSRKKEILRYLANLKSPAARLRNLNKVLAMLSGQTGRFLGRAWAIGAWPVDASTAGANSAPSAQSTGPAKPAPLWRYLRKMLPRFLHMPSELD
jgi:hypothetical protein